MKRLEAEEGEEAKDFMQAVHREEGSRGREERRRRREQESESGMESDIEFLKDGGEG